MWNRGALFQYIQRRIISIYPYLMWDYDYKNVTRAHNKQWLHVLWLCAIGLGTKNRISLSLHHRPICTPDANKRYRAKVNIIITSSAIPYQLSSVKPQLYINSTIRYTQSKGSPNCLIPLIKMRVCSTGAPTLKYYLCHLERLRSGEQLCLHKDHNYRVLPKYKSYDTNDSQE